MAITYEPIMTYSISGGSSITLSNIPQTYTDLILDFNMNGGSADNGWVYFNGSWAATQYSTLWITGNGSSVNNPTQVNSASLLYSMVTALQGRPSTMNIFNYTNSDSYKTMIMRSDDISYGTQLGAGTRRSTEAITSITLATQGYASLGTGQITLYGIKAA
jgi:hypothetical protein